MATINVGANGRSPLQSTILGKKETPLNERRQPGDAISGGIKPIYNFKLIRLFVKRNLGTKNG